MPLRIDLKVHIISSISMALYIWTPTLRLHFNTLIKFDIAPYFFQNAAREQLLDVRKQLAKVFV